HHDHRARVQPAGGRYPRHPGSAAVARIPPPRDRRGACRARGDPRRDRARIVDNARGEVIDEAMPGDALAAAVGQPAPHFTLPSVQGPTIDLKSYHGRRNVIVWFSRGFTCPFCRGYMQGVIEGYQNLLAQATEVVQVTPNLLESARRFFRPDPVPYRWCAIPTSGSTRCTGWATGACSPPRARAW